ncbi:hypothetical protein [Caulobacter sp. 17J65-9]|uniref:hypothetical protein n=1 Tax=Caulobacter sp. 17J65-9 TaxID=2709382 RepID=UPI0013C853A3|nr:hypothetical protein [Caulobacter sp. 17J65-9]NEX91600.1 hypothetical protein [Caulobacter sp. 17J65-9]
MTELALVLAAAAAGAIYLSMRKDRDREVLYETRAAFRTHADLAAARGNEKGAAELNGFAEAITDGISIALNPGRPVAGRELKLVQYRLGCASGELERIGVFPGTTRHGHAYGALLRLYGKVTKASVAPVSGADAA